MIRALLFILAVFYIFFFLVNNKDLLVQVHLLPGGAVNPVPLYLLILGTFLAGLILAVIMIFPGWLKLKLETRRQRKEIESLVEEVGHLRTNVPSPSKPATSSGPGSAED